MSVCYIMKKSVTKGRSYLNLVARGETFAELDNLRPLHNLPKIETFAELDNFGQYQYGR